MKIFSMILITLFFLSFTSIASAEEVYTITNNTSQDNLVVVYLEERYHLSPILIPRAYVLESDHCIEVTTSQFRSLVIQHFDNDPPLIETVGHFYASRRAEGSLCGGRHRCYPTHYEVNAKSWGLFREYPYTIETVDRGPQAGYCEDVTSWMIRRENKWELCREHRTRISPGCEHYHYQDD